MARAAACSRCIRIRRFYMTAAGRSTSQPHAEADAERRNRGRIGIAIDVEAVHPQLRRDFEPLAHPDGDAETEAQTMVRAGNVRGAAAEPVRARMAADG